VLGFQEYFVRERCRPAVRQLSFEGAGSARLSPAAEEALKGALRAIVIAPSNPYLSIDPILAIPGVRAALRTPAVPVIAVTPIIGDAAVKGPTAKIMRELGIVASPLSVIEHYRNLIDGFVLDVSDSSLAEQAPVAVQTCDTLMLTLEDRDRVARSTLELADALALGTRNR
jgi:LPPG:FO 2-phospho-L-lactate transferase